MVARPPSMVDVARLAGVAHVTVSRVLNEPETVRPQTRQRVLAAIEQLGYRRNDVARALKSGQTTAVGVVIAGSELFELARMLFGMETAASAAAYGVNLARWQGSEVEPFSAAVDRLTDRGAGGVVVFADRPVAAAALDELRTSVPVTVVMSGRLQNTALSTVEIDQDLGARAATRHLLDLGHRRIAHLAGDLDVFDARARLAGWQTEVSGADLEEAIVMEGMLTAASGFELGLQVAARRPRPTAVFAANDAMAMGVLAAFAQVGVRVPEDVSLVGFDDIPGAAYLVPALTTVRQDYFQLGERAMEVLLAQMAGHAPQHHRIRPELVQRRSTSAPGHADPTSSSTGSGAALT